MLHVKFNNLILKLYVLMSLVIISVNLMMYSLNYYLKLYCINYVLVLFGFRCCLFCLA